ncbi:hypothetical protein AVEN_28947-1 [Araneus ventricosus]|uniref:Uncharacterized protein n=1 Tax=Araneus ventricosus TaxID=182803 RepID=A0A4Y2ALM9_ARAVE|nr:hypothetical protein AVEN_28947-1 [Araneus ventricosus]
MAQLRPFNTVFQAELPAIEKAYIWTSKTNQQVKVWSDSESSLYSIASIDTKSLIAQQTQEILLKSTNIKLGWIRTHVGYIGNEGSDGRTSQESNTGGNSHMHPNAKTPYQESVSKRVPHPLAKRMGQWRKRKNQKQRFLWLRKPGKPLTLCYKLPVYNLIPPKKTVS